MYSLRACRKERSPKRITFDKHSSFTDLFRGQIIVPRQQLWIHRPGNVGKDVRPVHNGPLAPTVALNGGAIDRPRICRKVCKTAIRPQISDRGLSRFSFLTLRGRPVFF